MKNILLIIFLLLNFRAYSQSNKIIYIIPDSVEITIKKQLYKIRKVDSTTSFACLLSHNSDNTYSISILTNDKNSKKDFLRMLLNNTNRFVLIDKEKYPLIMDYDFKFSSPNLERIGEFGKREGNISRSRLLSHGYTIFFNSHGEIIKISDY